MKTPKAIRSCLCIMLFAGASVEVKSECREGQDAPAYHALDTYHDVPIEIEEVRLDNFAIALQEVADSKGYILTYAGKLARAAEAQARAERAKKYLVNKRGIKAERIVTINAGYREVLTIELYVVPNGAPAPVPAPTINPKEGRIIKDSKSNSRRVPRARRKQRPSCQ